MVIPVGTLPAPASERCYEVIWNSAAGRSPSPVTVLHHILPLGRPLPRYKVLILRAPASPPVTRALH